VVTKIARILCKLGSMVLWKETAFPLCGAMERRWKRNVVSRVSSVTVVIRLPILMLKLRSKMPIYAEKYAMCALC